CCEPAPKHAISPNSRTVDIKNAIGSRRNANKARPGIRLLGPGGRVWSITITASIKEEGPFAPLQRFSLEVPMGEPHQLLQQRIRVPKLDSMPLGRGRNQTIRWILMVPVP